eukprot:TRINITY_DN3469_c0_g3_i2.p4 TRINITY_DN3469_c0_g3~~TRINITY_DN3469_c0_g3_i2.p4  ORF type:complete len:104 (-),score=7.38 TRINITY_DN3469_c0_g3_i2:204-515(-)
MAARSAQVLRIRGGAGGCGGFNTGYGQHLRGGVRRQQAMLQRAWLRHALVLYAGPLKRAITPVQSQCSGNVPCALVLVRASRGRGPESIKCCMGVNLVQAWQE